MTRIYNLKAVLLILERDKKIRKDILEALGITTDQLSEALKQRGMSLGRSIRSTDYDTNASETYYTMSRRDWYI